MKDGDDADVELEDVRGKGRMVTIDADVELEDVRGK